MRGNDGNVYVIRKNCTPVFVPTPIGGPKSPAARRGEPARPVPPPRPRLRHAGVPRAGAGGDWLPPFDPLMPYFPDLSPLRPDLGTPPPGAAAAHSHSHAHSGHSHSH